MVIQCCHCKKLLRIDENTLPADRAVKVRCPHCREVGFAPDPKIVNAAREGSDKVAAEGPPYPCMAPLIAPAPAPAPIPDPVEAPTAARPPEPAAAAPSKPAPAPIATPSPTPPPRPEPQPVEQDTDWEDQHIPSDAFSSFRSPRKPAKEDSKPTPKAKPKATKFKLAVLALVSLAVVGFFALLVNVVLPGPAGHKPVIHTVPEDQRQPRSGVVEETLDPQKARDYRNATGQR